MEIYVLLAGLLILTAAPGETAPTRDEVPVRVQDALARRLGENTFDMDLRKVEPSQTLSGFVACGYASEHPDKATAVKRERFFVVIPGNFAVLDRDGTGLVEQYWQRYQC